MIPIGVYQNIGLKVFLSEWGKGLGSVDLPSPCCLGDLVSGLQFFFNLLRCKVGVGLGIICHYETTQNIK